MAPISRVFFCSTSILLLLQGAAFSPVFNVRDYGAQGDNTTDDTKAFVAAINDINLLEEQNTPTLIVPSGGIYAISPINLTSNMILCIESGASIVGIMDLTKYPLLPFLPSYGQGEDHPGPRFQSLIHGEHVHNVTMTGGGILDGQGSYWWAINDRGQENFTRPPLIEFMYASDIEIHHLEIRNSAFWTTHIYASQRVHVHHVSIKAPQDIWGSDGWDPDSSSDVLIESSVYEGGDDCVAVKSGWDCFGLDFGVPSKNVHIRNLTCKGPLASVAIGSEVSGGVENVLVEDIEYYGVDSVAHIKWGPTRGGYVRNVTFQRIVADGDLSSGIYIDGTYGSANRACPPDWQPPVLTDVGPIAFIDIHGSISGYDNSSAAYHLVGLEDLPVHNITISRTNFQSNSVVANWTCKHVTGTAEEDSVIPWPPCNEISVVATAPLTCSSAADIDHNIPCLDVPACSTGEAYLRNWNIIGNESVHPVQQTRGTVCWDNHGLFITSSADDSSVCSPYTSCGDETFVDADVIEVFVAPTKAATDAPAIYLELDVSPTGALWAGAINDTRGTAPYCTLSGRYCDNHFGPFSPCFGASTFVPIGLTAGVCNVTAEDSRPSGWNVNFSIPWATFDTFFQPSKLPNGSLVPWNTWRLNLYRTDVNAPTSLQHDTLCGDETEQSSWAHVEDHFHDPPKFGYMFLV